LVQQTKKKDQYDIRIKITLRVQSQVFVIGIKTPISLTKEKLLKKLKKELSQKIYSPLINATIILFY